MVKLASNQSRNAHFSLAACGNPWLLGGSLTMTGALVIDTQPLTSTSSNHFPRNNNNSLATGCCQMVTDWSLWLRLKMWIWQRNRGALQADWVATNQLQGTSALKAYLAYATIIYTVNLMLSLKNLKLVMKTMNSSGKYLARKSWASFFLQVECNEMCAQKEKQRRSKIKKKRSNIVHCFFWLQFSFT